MNTGDGLLGATIGMLLLAITACTTAPPADHSRDQTQGSYLARAGTAVSEDAIASIASIADGSANRDMPTEPESAKESQEAAWALLESALDACVSRSVAMLGLRPSLDQPELAWSAGKLRGLLRGWALPGTSPWAVRYESRQVDGDAKSVGFTVWLAPEIAVPHLAVHVGVRNGRATLMADHLPRWDLAKHPELVEEYYGGEYAARWIALQRRGDGIRAFSSSDPTVRAVQGPNAIALMADIGPLALQDEGGAEHTLAEILRDHCRRWTAFVENYDPPRPDDPAMRRAIGERDLSVRKMLRDHEQAAGERVMNRETAAALANHLAGFSDASAEPAER